MQAQGWAGAGTGNKSGNEVIGNTEFAGNSRKEASKGALTMIKHHSIMQLRKEFYFTLHAVHHPEKSYRN